MQKETEDFDRDFCDICQTEVRTHMTNDGEERV